MTPKKKQTKKRKKPSLKRTRSSARIKNALRLAIQSAKKLKNKPSQKTTKNKRKRKTKSALKKGGFLPLLAPIFAGIGALGALAHGGASVYKSVKSVQAEQQQLDEAKRHNLAMEQKGKGLYLRPYRGKGLYLHPYPHRTRSGAFLDQ